MRQIPLSDYIPKVLPSGWYVISDFGDGNAYKYRTGINVIVSTASMPDSREWMHISVSRNDRLPSFDDLKFVKSIFAGDNRYAYQVFAPVEKHVNIHNFCLHLWVPLTGELPLPDFTLGGNSI